MVRRTRPKREFFQTSTLFHAQPDEFTGWAPGPTAPRTTLSFESLTGPALKRFSAKLYRIASHIPVLLAIYTPSLEINDSSGSVRRTRVAHTGKPPACHKRVLVITLKVCSGVIRAVPGWSENKTGTHLAVFPVGMPCKPGKPYAAPARLTSRDEGNAGDCREQSLPSPRHTVHPEHKRRLA
jgi:hypothetical protein